MQDMDTVLEQARGFVSATEAALKDVHGLLDGHSKQVETAALRTISNDIKALEFNIRKAKWAISSSEKEALASQIDVLMLQVMQNCRQHQDQAVSCQELLSDIVSWCEQGTSAYRFVVEPSAAARGPASNRYSSSGGSDAAGSMSAQTKCTSGSRIPNYTSPTKKRGQGTQGAASHSDNLQQQQPLQPLQPLLMLKNHSRIPQPKQQQDSSSSTRKSLPDAQHQQTPMDQACDDSAPMVPAVKGNGSSGSTAAALQPPAFDGHTSAAAPHVRSGAAVSRIPSAGGAGPASSNRSSVGGSSTDTAAMPNGASLLMAAQQQQQQQVPVERQEAAQAPSHQPEQQQKQQSVAAAKAAWQQRTSNGGATAVAAGGGSGSASGSLVASSSSGPSAFGSAAAPRVSSRTLLQLEPSRDDMPLRSASQLQQSQQHARSSSGGGSLGVGSAAAVLGAPAAAAAPAVAAANSEAGAGVGGGSRAGSDGSGSSGGGWLHHELQQQASNGGASGAGASFGSIVSTGAMMDMGLTLRVARPIPQTTADALAALQAVRPGNTDHLAPLPSDTPLAALTSTPSYAQQQHQQQQHRAFGNLSVFSSTGGYAAASGRAGNLSDMYASLGYASAGASGGTVAAAGGAGGGGRYQMGANPMRVSQEVGMMLRDSAIMEAALLACNASRMHILHDAVAHKRQPAAADAAAPDVPPVPPSLAVQKKKHRSTLGKVVRAVAGLMAVGSVAVAGVVAAKEAEEGNLFQGLKRQGQQGASSSSSSKERPRKQQGGAEAAGQLPFAPMGPAPDASAGCG